MFAVQDIVAVIVRCVIAPRVQRGRMWRLQLIQRMPPPHAVHAGIVTQKPVHANVPMDLQEMRVNA